MHFEQGAQVFTADGERVGTIDRIVIEPDTREVTHLVIQKGFLFTKDKVIPISLVKSAVEDRVTLHENAGSLEEFPDFQESHYISTEVGHLPRHATRERIKTVYWYPPIGGIDGYVYNMQNDVVETKNIPEETVAIAEGANVISNDGEHVGEVERIFTDTPDERVTHLLISEGIFLKKKKLIPTRWVTNVFEHEIHISVDSDLVEQLPEYQI
jgi:uncharacterized protein YrrD